MNDKDKLISFINKGKENNPIKEVHVIKDNDTENHILLVNEDGTSIASNKFEVGGASGDNSESTILRKDATFVSKEEGTIVNTISLSSEEYNKIKNGKISIIYGVFEYDVGSTSNYTVQFNSKIENMYIYSYTDINDENNEIEIVLFQLVITEESASLYKIMTTQPSIPALPSDASTKTYTLKAINGTLTWVE